MYHEVLVRQDVVLSIDKIFMGKKGIRPTMNRAHILISYRRTWLVIPPKNTAYMHTYSSRGCTKWGRGMGAEVGTIVTFTTTYHTLFSAGVCS